MWGERDGVWECGWVEGGERMDEERGDEGKKKVDRWLS